MSAALALAAAEAVGVRIALDGSDLILDADAPPTPAVLAGLRQHKAGIVALLRFERRWSDLAVLAEPAAVALPPAAVRAALECIVEPLTIDHWRAAEAARKEALDILRVELRRDPRLIPPQVDPHRCVTCGYPETMGRPLVAVLTGLPDEHRWLHAGLCHGEYRRRLTALVDATMAGAGLM